jgi:hypothetical protein
MYEKEYVIKTQAAEIQKLKKEIALLKNTIIKNNQEFEKRIAN